MLAFLPQFFVYGLHCTKSHHSRYSTLWINFSVVVPSIFDTCFFSGQADVALTTPGRPFSSFSILAEQFANSHTCNDECVHFGFCCCHQITSALYPNQLIGLTDLFGLDLCFIKLDCTVCFFQVHFYFLYAVKCAYRFFDSCNTMIAAHTFD